MQIFFNELSIPPFENPQQNQETQIVQALISTLKAINKLNKNQQPSFLIKNHDIFNYNTNFICQKSLLQLSSDLPREEKTAILSFMQRIVILSTPPSDLHTEQRTTRQTDSFSSYTNEAEKSISICLHTSNYWDQPELHFISTATQAAETLPNITNIDLTTITNAITCTTPLLKYFASRHQDQKGEILTKSSVSNFLIEDKSFSKALKAASTLTADQRNAVFGVVGSTVAEINNYIHNRHLSTINSTNQKTRKIFTSTDQETHISIDFMHGCFEVHNKNGKHLKEISFSGEEISPRDKKGKHDIKVN